MTMGGRSQLLDRIINDRVVLVLTAISVVLGVVLIALGVFVVFEPLTEFGVYAISSVFFLAILVFIAWELNRRRPRSASRLRSRDSY